MKNGCKSWTQFSVWSSFGNGEEGSESLSINPMSDSIKRIYQLKILEMKVLQAAYHVVQFSCH